MADYRLYCTAVSGNCYKVALMLSLSKCRWEPVLVDYMGGETRGEKFRSELNELGEIPVLEHGAKRLTQSGAILTYLARRTGRFEGRNKDERGRSSGVEHNLPSLNGKGTATRRQRNSRAWRR